MNKRGRCRFSVATGVLTLTAGIGFPAALRAAEPTDAPVANEAAASARDAEIARREALATRIVTPEALKVMSALFNKTMFTSSFRATVVREYEEKTAHGVVPRRQKPDEWTRADVLVSVFGGKVTRYWPGRSETLVANPNGLFATDSRFLKQYTVEKIPAEDTTNGKWRDTFLGRADLGWGALAALSSHNGEFASILLNKGLISVTLAAPETLDGVTCDPVEIRIVNNDGGLSLFRIAIARTDGFARLLEIHDDLQKPNTEIVREKYLRVDPMEHLGPGILDEEASFNFVPPRGSKRVAAFHLPK